jgi:hypothetical protein
MTMTAGMTGSEGVRAAPPAGRWVLAAVLAVAAAAVFWLLPRNAETPLVRSTMGHAGLLTWLQANDVPARMAGPPVKAASVGLNVVPVFDTDLFMPFTAPETREDYLRTGTEIDLSPGLLIGKRASLPVLVVAPKWQRAARLSGYAHPSLLLTPREASNAVRLLGATTGDLVRPDTRLLTLPGGDRFGGLSATLYAPQLFSPNLGARCTSLIGGAEGHLLIECRDAARTFWVLSDPDLMNNHGLSVGDNAALVLAVIRELSGERPVLIDYTDFNFVVDDTPPPYRRGWADLMRFFGWPFSVIWLGSLGVLVLALWRGGLRFGPPVALFDDRAGASKSVSIAAKARLLRLSGNDSRLLATHAGNRLRAVLADIVGPGGAGGDALSQLCALAARRSPDRARALRAAAEALTTLPEGLPVDAMLARLDAFETEAERTLQEHGRHHARA